MRTTILILVVVLAATGSATAQPTVGTDLAALEQAWHSCLREVYLQQSGDRSRPGRERQALGQCRSHEDAYVAALMAARAGGSELQVLAWAKTWAGSIAAYVIDPVEAWIASLRR